VRELCGGDITRRDWVLWNVTWNEAIDWCRFRQKQRYEWVEIVGRMFGMEESPKAGKGEKPCRHPDLCSICKKQCGARMTAFRMQ
jgi:hypothetical protein